MNLISEGFLVGVIATASFTVGILFLKYWRRSHDFLFLAFGAAFIIEAFNHASLLLMTHPNEADTVYYVVRLISFLLIFIGILRKNYERA